MLITSLERMHNSSPRGLSQGEEPEGGRGGEVRGRLPHCLAMAVALCLPTPWSWAGGGPGTGFGTLGWPWATSCHPAVPWHRVWDPGLAPGPPPVPLPSSAMAQVMFICPCREGWGSSPSAMEQNQTGSCPSQTILGCRAALPQQLGWGCPCHQHWGLGGLWSQGSCRGSYTLTQAAHRARSWECLTND